MTRKLITIISLCFTAVISLVYWGDVVSVEDREVAGLLIPVYLRAGEGWGSVEEEGGITLGQADSQALVQMPDLVRLLLPSVPGKS